MWPLCSEPAVKRGRCTRPSRSSASNAAWYELHSARRAAVISATRSSWASSSAAVTSLMR